MRAKTALLFSLCTLFFSLRSQNRAIDSINNLIKNAASPEQAAIEKAGLVLRYMSAGDIPAARKAMAESLDEAETLRSDKALGAAYNAQGIYYYYNSAFDSALFWFDLAIKHRQAANDQEGLAKVLSNVGGIYFMMRDYKKARSQFEQAMKVEEQMGKEPGTYVSLNNVGTLYRELEIFPKAEFFYRKGIALYKKRKDLDNLSSSYDGLSGVFSDRHQLDSAMHYALMARDAAEHAGDLSTYSYARHNIALILHKTRKYRQAVEELRAVEPYTRQLGDKRLLLGVYGNIAANFIEMNQLDSALPYVDLIIPLQKDLNAPAISTDLNKIFGEYYFRKGEYKKAYEHVRAYDHIRDSIYNIEMTAELAELQEKYESEKKDRENRLLQTENREYRTTRNYLLVILSIALLSIVGGIFAYSRIRRAHRIIRNQKELVEQKQQEIIDSINYARRIQYALLASQQLLKKYLPEHFVLFKPKAVVSGDFYWASPTDDGFAIVAGDCTGHGVPGAFMSLLNITKLGQVINEQKITRPDLVLNKVRDEIIRSLNPEEGAEEGKDGMDAILCKFRLDQLKLEYAAANNSFYIVRNKKLLTCKADKMPVGKGHDDTRPFTFNEVALEKGDVIYLFTDGFADQFGGPLGKKFKYKQLEQLLVSLSEEPMEKQKAQLEKEFEKWRGALEQVDDVCVIGVKV